MNWAIRSLRLAPAALRTPTSTALRAARAVIKVTKLIAATTTIRRPTAAMAARTPGSAEAFALKMSSVDGVRWMRVSGRKWVARVARDALAAFMGKRASRNAGIRAARPSTATPGFSRT